MSANQLFVHLVFLIALFASVEVGEKALNEWGKAEGELLFAKRAPEPRYDLWKKRGVLPRKIDREIVEIMHRTHIGVDQDYKP